MSRNVTFNSNYLNINGHLYIPEDNRRASLAPLSSPVMRSGLVVDDVRLRMVCKRRNNAEAQAWK